MILSLKLKNSEYFVFPDVESESYLLEFIEFIFKDAFKRRPFFIYHKGGK
ncbi:hypothetical protein ATHSA_0200 [Athalassotoga saccharophila]|nr:hypothetical protein ATHSA_0200 [Athalassotoga saccharophila]